MIIINITLTSRKSPTERKEIMSLFNKYEDEDEDDDIHNHCQQDNITSTRMRMRIVIIIVNKMKYQVRGRGERDSRHLQNQRHDHQQVGAKIFSISFEQNINSVSIKFLTPCWHKYFQFYTDTSWKSALFPKICRANHSCVPNCNYVWNPELGQQQMFLVKKVSKDQILVYCHYRVYQKKT